jgi:opacity protein-like surface antigen/outer membrane protease
MQKRGIWLVIAVLVLLPSIARADGAAKPAVVEAAAPFHWTGYYFGAHLGSGLGLTDISNPYGPSIYGGTVRTPEFLIGLQGGYNWQAPGSNWLLGAEAELSWLDASGSNTCFAFSGEFISSNCSAAPDFTGALTGRLGYAAGPSGRTLLYVKGGGAFVHNDITATTNRGFYFTPGTETSTSSTKWGWLVGAGLEQALTPAWSLKFEYDYRAYADTDLVTPASVLTNLAGDVTPVEGRMASVDQSNHLVKIGVNYRLGTDPGAAFADTSASGSAPYALPTGWRFQPALRYWYSVGRYDKTLPATGPLPSTSTRLISRLTWDDLTANAGEFYGRVDTPWHIFAKGFIGGGRINGGHLNDEDWGIDAGAPGYSNTLSQLVGTGMNYAAVDVGTDVMHGADYRAGLFVGYAHVHEQYFDDTCVQLAAPSQGCVPATFGQPGITETDNWNALRLGAAADVWLTPNLQLTADAAYLPYVQFKGRDHHWQRDLVIDGKGTGQGGQLELLLSYYLTQDFSVGVGGRYWAMWTTSGSDVFDGEPLARTDIFRYERAGVFLQGAYTFDGCCAN